MPGTELGTLRSHLRVEHFITEPPLLTPGSLLGKVTPLVGRRQPWLWRCPARGAVLWCQKTTGQGQELRAAAGKPLATALALVECHQQKGPRTHTCTHHGAYWRTVPGTPSAGMIPSVAKGPLGQDPLTSTCSCFASRNGPNCQPVGRREGPGEGLEPRESEAACPHPLLVALSLPATVEPGKSADGRGHWRLSAQEMGALDDRRPWGSRPWPPPNSEETHARGGGAKRGHSLCRLPRCRQEPPAIAVQGAVGWDRPSPGLPPELPTRMQTSGRSRLMTAIRSSRGS